MTDGRFVRRAEDQVVSINPLKDALSNFGTDGKGNSFASAAIDSAQQISTNKLPANLINSYVTGLIGWYTVTQKTVIGTGTNAQTFPRGMNVYWNIRWDYDKDKGPHVNAQFGSKKSVKIAYTLDQSKYDKDAKTTMANKVNELNQACKYSQAKNAGKTGEPDWDSNRDQAMQDLKNHFKSVANAPC